MAPWWQGRGDLSPLRQAALAVEGRRGSPAVVGRGCEGTWGSSRRADGVGGGSVRRR